MLDIMIRYSTCPSYLLCISSTFFVLGAKADEWQVGISKSTL